jgi:DNA-binding NarL/FixJ family response regulator
MLDLLIVEDNPRLAAALRTGFTATGRVTVLHSCGAGEEALGWCLAQSATAAPRPAAVLMDVQLDGAMNGVQTAVALRREFPRLPVVFYSIQDDAQYYRDFRAAGILSHYAYVRKSNYLLPELVLPLLLDAVAGRSFIDPEIEARVEEIRTRDALAPMALLEPHEQQVARLLAQGLTNEQIADRMGFRDKRTVSRINGQVYAAWGLADSTTDEKVARTRAALIVAAGRLLTWDVDGTPLAETAKGWAPWSPAP